VPVPLFIANKVYDDEQSMIENHLLTVIKIRKNISGMLQLYTPAYHNQRKTGTEGALFVDRW
jgi:hypothetical protein